MEMFCKNPEKCSLFNRYIKYSQVLPRIFFWDCQSFVGTFVGLKQEFVEEMDEGDGVLLGGKYGHHQVGGQTSPPQGLVQDCLGQNCTSYSVLWTFTWSSVRVEWKMKSSSWWNVTPRPTVSRRGWFFRRDWGTFGRTCHSNADIMKFSSVRYLFTFANCKL